MKSSRIVADNASASQVSVVVRVRPPLPAEAPYGFCTRVDGRRIVFDASPPKGKEDHGVWSRTDRTKSKSVECEYDKVFDMTSSQDDIWNTVRPKVEKVLEGYNATIFTYGMTGSGKTFTMLGPRLMSVAWEDHRGPTFQEVQQCPKRGVVPRAVDLLLERMGGKQAAGSNVRVTMSYLQIYRERCYDLLQPASNAPALRVREDTSSRSSGNGAVYVESLTEAPVQTPEECIRLLLYGSSNIAFRSTAYNEQSSRSHVILTLTVHQTMNSRDGVVRQSKLHLVDLAGNERWDSFGPGMSPVHAKEMTSINHSLHVLGTCVQALSQRPPISKRTGQPEPVHVPYRNSALTMLLRDSLGGSSYTTMLCTICSCPVYQMQSLTTLRFADRAKRVKMRAAKVNETVDAKMLLRQSQAEVAYLRSLIAEGGATAELEQRLKELESENETLKEKVQCLTTENQAAIEASRAVAKVDTAEAWRAGPVAGTIASRAQKLRRANSEPALPDTRFAELVEDLETGTAGPSNDLLRRTAAPALLAGIARSPSPKRASTVEAGLHNRQDSHPEATVVEAPVRVASQSRSQQLASQLREGAPVARCPEGHGLVCLGSTRHPLGSCGYSEWNCDAGSCREGSQGNPDLSRYHCRECQYDICERCCCLKAEAPPSPRRAAEVKRPSPISQVREPVSPGAASSTSLAKERVASSPCTPRGWHPTAAARAMAASAQAAVTLAQQQEHPRSPKGRSPRHAPLAPHCEARAAAAAADEAAAAALSRASHPPRAPPGKPRAGPRGPPHSARGRAPAPRHARSLSARRPSPAERHRQALSDSLRLPPESMKLPAIANPKPVRYAPQEVSGRGASQFQSDGEDYETQRQPWLQQCRSQDEASRTQRRFHQVSSPRRQASMSSMPTTASCSSERDLAEVNSYDAPSSRPLLQSGKSLTSKAEASVPLTVRTATGAPLSPLGPTLGRGDRSQYDPAKQAATAAAAKKLTALHSRLGIGGLLEPLPVTPPAEDTDATPAAPNATVPSAPKVPSAAAKLPAAFGNVGKASGIGDLLGELDSRRRLET